MQKYENDKKKLVNLGQECYTKNNSMQLCKLGAVHKQRRPLGGGGVKNWLQLPTDSTKKLPIWGRGVSKIQKNCRRRLWSLMHIS